MPTEPVAVIDFETTGLNPAWGDRPTEVAIAVVQGDTIIDRYQSLMNPGRPIPWDVQALTGITDRMVADAPPVAEVMREAARFVGDLPLVAHNAPFDRKFWETELARLGTPPQPAFACTLLLARRVYPQAPNHRLGTLIDLLQLPRAGRAHRAMADAEMAGHLWMRIRDDVRSRFGVREAGHGFFVRLQKVPKGKVEGFCRAGS
jgi:DNA polymerase-3 subunit epsilon